MGKYLLEKHVLCEYEEGDSGCEPQLVPLDDIFRRGELFTHILGSQPCPVQSPLHLQNSRF